MRRYDESHTLSAAAARHQISAGRLTQLAQLLAGNHRVCPSRTDRAGAVTVRHETQKNLGELADQLTACDDREQTLTLGRFLQAFTAANADMLDARARAGAIREAHGDSPATMPVTTPPPPASWTSRTGARGGPADAVSLSCAACPPAGSSHLAQAISASAGLPMISSDVVRKTARRGRRD